MKNTLETVDGVEYCAPTRRVIREHAHLQGGDLVPAFLAELRQLLHAEDVSSGGRYQRPSLMNSSVMLHPLFPRPPPFECDPDFAVGVFH